MSSRRLVVHVAQIAATAESGMGRVALHWKAAFERAGYMFRHIGSHETGKLHPAAFPFAAYRRARAHDAIFLVHEPSSLPFVRHRRSLVVFSHGLEQRGWQDALVRQKPSPRSRLLFPLYRLLPSRIGLRHAAGVIVLNSRDAADATRLRRHKVRPNVKVARNGIEPCPIGQDLSARRHPTILFIGSWIERKGVHLLTTAITELRREGLSFELLIAGSGRSSASVLEDFPEDIRPIVSVLESFPAQEELSIFAAADIFALPSTFEGQPLALLQAMECGLCCVASDIPGIRDLVRPKENGLLFPPGSCADMEHALRSALSSPDLRRELGLSARRSVADRAWPLVSDEIVRFVEESVA